MTVDEYPPGNPDPFAAILAIGDSWFWYPKINLLASILALKQLDPNYKTAHVLSKNSALLSEYRTGKFAAMWRNEITVQNLRFSLVLISGGGNDSVDFAFPLKPDCTGIAEPKDCFDIDKLNHIVDTLIGIMAAVVSDVQIAAQRAKIRTPPVLLNGYDHPVLDGRGFSPISGEKFKFGRPWVAPAMERAKVDSALAFRTAVIGIYIDALNTAMQHLANRTTGVFCPHALGTLRTAPATYQQDWDNELHPTKSGFTKLAKGPWLKQLDALGFTRA